MHESGVCQAIIEAVDRLAAGRPVRNVRVKVGAQHRIDAAALNQAFTLLTPGTSAEGAALDVVEVPIEARCNDCGAISPIADPHDVCPSCRSPDIEVSGGDQILLDEIEVATVG